MAEIKGQIVFLPWVTVPEAISFGDFCFVPLEIDNLHEQIGDVNLAEHLRSIFSSYVDLRGQPITSCTIISLPNNESRWLVPIDEEFDFRTRQAVDVLAFSMLSQREFCNRLSSHVNGANFGLIRQNIVVGDSNIAVVIERIDGRITLGGVTHRDVKFQEPIQIYATSNLKVLTTLLDAISQGLATSHDAIHQLLSALPVWLLANSEYQMLPSDNCVTLSAFAFEKMLNKEAGAKSLADAFRHTWKNFATINIEHSKHVKADNNEHHAGQQTLPILWKWAKELYESRNAFAHRGPKSTLTSNWTTNQHMLFSAYAFPLTAKLLLSNAGLYQVTELDEGSCLAFEKLLEQWDPAAEHPLAHERKWNTSDGEPPSWSDIVTSEIGSFRFSRLNQPTNR